MTIFSYASAVFLIVLMNVSTNTLAADTGFLQAVGVMNAKFNNRCAVAEVIQELMQVKYQCISESGQVAVLTGSRCLSLSNNCRPYVFKVCHEPGWQDCEDAWFFPPGNLPAEQTVATIRSMI